MTQHCCDKPRLATLLLTILLPVCAFALPDDATQEIVMDYTTSDLFLDEGLIVLRGAKDKPARITQGSLEISGTEIRLERAADSSLKKVTATGSPARFQQQPEADQELVHASGMTLVFDNEAQLLTIDDNAEFSQAGNVLTHQHIEYNLDTRSASANSASTDAQGRMVIPPPATGN